MSVMLTVKFPTVPAGNQEKIVEDYRDTMMAIIEDAKRHGALHHFFAEDTDGNLLVVDEWPDEESWQQFFAGQEDIKKVMAAAGATTEPTVTTYRILDTPDRF